MFTTSLMRCDCPPLAVDMNINGRLSAVLAFTSTGYVRASWRRATPSQAPTVLRTGYDTCCGRVEERDAVGNLIRSSQAYCSTHEPPVGSRGIARTVKFASCLRRPRPAYVRRTASRCGLSTTLRRQSPRRFSPRRFVWRRESDDADVNDNCVYSGHVVSRYLGGVLPPPPCARPPTCGAAGRLGIYA